MSVRVGVLDGEVMVRLRCCHSHCLYWVFLPSFIEDRLRDSGASFYCPAGHSQSFEKPRTPPERPDPPSPPPRYVRQMTTRDRALIERLREWGPGTVRELAEKAGWTSQRMQSALYLLLQSEAVERQRHFGIWRHQWGYDRPCGNAYVYRVKESK